MSSRLRSQSNRGLQLLDLLPNVSGALLHTKAWDDDLGGVRWTFASGCVASLIPLCQTAKLSLSQEATMLFQFHSHFLAILRVDSIVDLSKRSTSSTVIQTSQVVAGICIFNRHGHVSACGLVCGPGETRFQQSRAELIGSPQWHKMQNIYISSFKTISYPPAHFRRNRTANIFCIRCIYIYIYVSAGRLQSRIMASIHRQFERYLPSIFFPAFGFAFTELFLHNHLAKSQKSMPVTKPLRTKPKKTANLPPSPLRKQIIVLQGERTCAISA